MADDTTYTGQSTKGASLEETSKRKAQTKKEGEMADRAAVQEKMAGTDLAAAARRAAEKRKAKATPTPSPTPTRKAKRSAMSSRGMTGYRG